MTTPTKNPYRYFLLTGIIAMVFSIGLVEAEEVTPSKQELLRLSDTVQEKKSRLEELGRQIDVYKKRIAEKQKEQISLANQIALLENRVAKTLLDIEATGVAIEEVGLEIEILDREILLREEQIERDRKILAELLRELRIYDEQSPLEIFLGADTLSDVFVHMSLLENVQDELQTTVDEVRAVKAEQETRRTEREERRIGLEDLKKELERKELRLEEEQGTREYLLTAAEASETRFQALLSELRAESQLIDTQVSSLERQLRERLRAFDVDFGVGTLFSWPLLHVSVITTYFHDPDYPFRYLFEHSGIDLRAEQGTPVLAAAPGIVAVAKTGRLYGNYVVVIHPNGTSTLYAHLSRIRVEPEQFVQRGETIGLSGGARSTPGAGLSTGPHLHFEVRVEGIPTNPLEYLGLP